MNPNAAEAAEAAEATQISRLMCLEDWFLTPQERGNPSTLIDRRRRLTRTAWTTGNHVEVLVDGAAYFRHLHGALCGLGRGDGVLFADWEGDADEQLCGPGTEVGVVLAELARRGVHVRGLLWRSHPRQAHFAEQDNIGFTRALNRAGGEVLLDERVRHVGSHHQKLVIVRHAESPERDVAYAGGIDLCHGRHDDSGHAGDVQPVEIASRYGARPPWHDVQLAVNGPAIADLEHTFRERWDDPTPLDHRNPWRMAIRRVTGQPRRPDPLPFGPSDPAPCGTQAVQVLRTYPAKRPRYPFAAAGERSIARAYLKAIRRARSLVYLEDQYLWSLDAADALADGLRRHAGLRVVLVVPRYPDRDGRATMAAGSIGRERFTNIVRGAGGGRVALYDLENAEGTPIYVHAKVCIIDDVWTVVGSDNLNRRSWTHDSEISCSIIDSVGDTRAPLDPGGLGDGARRFARETRLRLWREHLGRAHEDDDDLVDPVSGFDALARSASELDQWHESGRDNPRPPGHLRRHQLEPVATTTRWWARAMYRLMLDPDGRPRKLARTGGF
jgi:phosphatidylserine/phosphatidylglycerophosphate/cardiolipin synthase-like enzyme